MKKILILILMFLLVGCQGQIQETIAMPTGIDVYNLSEKDEVIVGGETLKLVAIVSPVNASQKVVWSSSDDSIASVDENGVVIGHKEGSVKIIATSYVDTTIQSEISVSVYDDANQLATIESIKEFLDRLIPSETTTDLNLHNIYNDARLSWSSSDINTISKTGRVSQASTDKYVTLTCNISFPRVQGVFSKEVMVKKYELRELPDKLTFTYLYDYGNNFDGFNEGDLDKIDVINYAFGGIVGGELSVSSQNNFARIIKEAHAKGVRVVLAIGGWGVDGFSDAVSSKANRQKFIASIIKGINDYRLDGIDFDWEYPTSTAGGLIKASPYDKANFTLLCQELRTAMDQINPDLILSIAVANGAWAADTYYEVSKLNQYIDFLHLMSYDIINFGTSTNPIIKASHHTNLYASPYSVGSADAGVKAYASRGIDPSKIIMGIAFYGHAYVVDGSGTNGMGANCDTSNTANKFTVSYKTIVEEYLSHSEIYKIYIDKQAQASWIYGNNLVISFDEHYSIAAKCDYVNLNNLGGVMVWQYNQDDNQSSLLNAIYDNLNK